MAGMTLDDSERWDRHPGVRTGRRLSPGERAADVIGRVAGSWAWLLGSVVVALAGGPARVAAVPLAAMAVVLMAVRRADRIAAEVALYHLDQARRATAIAEDLRGEMQRLHADVARIAASAERSGQPVRRP
jgi:hypothetical protein